MKFSVHTFIWSSSFGPPEFALLPVLKERGFDGVEIPLARPQGFPAAEIRKALAAYGLECIASSFFVGELSLISDDSATRAKTKQHLSDVIRTAADTGAHTIAGPLYSAVGYLPGRRRTDNEWSRAVEAYQEIGPLLESNDVTIALEPLNRFETYFLNTAADAVRLCDAINHPRVGILFDTFHANIEEKDIGAALRATAKHLKHVHTCENDRGTPGSGHVEWPAVFSALRDLRYDSWLTIESFGFQIEDVSAAAAIWRDIERTPETIAFEGIQFLKRNLSRGAQTA